MATLGLEAVCADAQAELPEDSEIRISLGRGRVDVTVWDSISGECIAWQPRDGTSLEGQVADALEAERRRRTATALRCRSISVELGEKLFEFSSKQDWINRANRIWKLHETNAQQTVCVDQLGRICGWGQHFADAERDDAYPIEVFRMRAEHRG